MSVLVSLGIGSVVYLSIKTLRDRLTRAATIYADRNAQRKRVIGDEESAEWINTVLWRFWQFYEPVLCQNLREAIQPALDANTPAGLKRLELGRLTLGKTPPFISSARLLLRDNHHNEISESRIVLNLGLGFHAPDLEVVVAAKVRRSSPPSLPPSLSPSLSPPFPRSTSQGLIFDLILFPSVRPLPPAFP